jgi:antitoxin component YwqK of YwqJK toxin-antitoxin module
MSAWYVASVVLAVALSGCTGSASGSETVVEATDARLRLDNGVYRLDDAPFSGIIIRRFARGALKQRGVYRAGRQHGLTSSFYEDGRLRERRRYVRGKANGSHDGWWPSGSLRFSFNYVDDKREGVQRQWYVTGGLYTELRFRDDREHGIQRAFRENGKAYINYEVRDGFKYGLSKSALCTSLENEIAKTGEQPTQSEVTR